MNNVRYYLILLGSLASGVADGQQVSWNKELSKDLDKYKLQVANSAKEDWIKLENLSNNANGRQKPKLEKTVFFKDNSSYVLKYFDGESKRQVVKRTSGAEKMIEFSQEGELVPIGEEGYMIYNDFAHGDGVIFQFLSPELDKLNLYRPFLLSYTQMKIGSSNDNVCIYSLENTDSPSYKITLLDINGNERVSKEFQLGKHTAFKIEVTGDKVFLFLHVYNSSVNDYSSKIIAFDFLLNKLWEKDFPNRIGFYPQSNKLIGALFFVHNNDIISINGSTGSILWSISADDFSSIPTGLERIIEERLVLESRFLLVNAGIYNRAGKEYLENVTVIIDSINGNILFKESQGATNYKIGLVALKDSFIIVKDGQIIEYKKK